MTFARTLGHTALLSGLLLTGLPSALAQQESPAAMVEAIDGAPGAGVGFLDYVYPGKIIKLGGEGRLVLSYFGTCLTETIVGGTVTVAQGASELDGGEINTKKTPCVGAEIVVTEETSEPGATVSRVTPFDGQNWAEWTIKTQTPIFKWPATIGEGTATVTVLDMDFDPPRVVWQGKTEASHLTYPAKAPELRIGVPYQVEVARPGADVMAAVFSHDPDIEVPDTLLSRVVPVGR